MWATYGSTRRPKRHCEKCTLPIDTVPAACYTNEFSVIPHYSFDTVTSLLRSLSLAFVLAILLLVACEPPDPAEPAPEQADWIQDGIVYEMFIPDFSEEGTFEGATENFDHLEDLNVTTIWLMPIHPIGEERAKTDIGPLGSPYSIRDYYDVNPDYGSQEDFQAFVDSAHARDMRVIIDLVVNHTAWDHPWLEENPDWYEEGPIDGFTIPVLNGDTTDWTDVVQLDLQNEEVRTEMKNVMQFWVDEFNIDGYRADVAHQVPLDFWDAAIDSVEAVKDPVFMLAEAAEPEMHDVGFDMTYSWPEYGTLLSLWEDGAPASDYVESVVSHEAELAPPGQRLQFTTNHDETAWDAPPPELFGGLDGSEAAFVLVSSMPGAPLVYNGQELGVQDTVSFFEATPYDWDQENSLLPFYQEFLEVYAGSPALHRGELEIHSPNAEDALLYSRVAENDEMLFAVNVRDDEASVSLPAEHTDRTWTDVFSGETESLDELDLDPYEYRIFRAAE